MSLEDEYQGLITKSWKEPVTQVNEVIVLERKTKNKLVSSHSRENHEYHMDKYGRCVYCNRGIPLEGE